MELFTIKTSVISEVTKSYSLVNKNTYDVSLKSEIVKKLRQLIEGKNGIIDGEQLRNFVFPTDDYDVFISHSHDDLNTAQTFAAWLHTECGLNVFLDSFVWESADKLLKEIDDLYCRHDDSMLYSYNSRNHSTSHVHTMLSMSIFEIMKNCSIGIFIETKNSVNLNNIRDKRKTKTFSPWIFQEIMYMRQFALHESKRESRIFSRLDESLKIEHNIDLAGFKIMTIDVLDNLRKKHKKKVYLFKDAWDK